MENDPKNTDKFCENLGIQLPQNVTKIDSFQVGFLSSSSSFELFVVSVIQEDVYIGHTALALMLGLQIFS